MDKLKPRYNTLKTAGSSSGHKLSDETKAKISKALKGVYVKEKSPLFGRIHTCAEGVETKMLMSITRSKINNTGKTLTCAEGVETKELMRQEALAKVYYTFVKLF